MPRPFAQFDAATEQEILDLVRERRGQPQGRKRAGKRNYGPRGGAGGAAPTAVYGVVASSTAAHWDNACNAMVDGEIQAWPFLVAADLPPFDAGASYQSGALVNLTDPGQGAPGVKCANGAVSPGPYDPADWTSVVADRFLDRGGPTTTLPLRFTAPPPVGALVAWLGGEVIVLTCKPLDGWA